MSLIIVAYFLKAARLKPDLALAKLCTTLLFLGMGALLIFFG